MNRRKARVAAFQLVFEMNLNSMDSSEALELAKEIGEPETDEFSNALVESTWNNKVAIEAMVTPHLKGWRIDRISKVALAVLQISCAQLLYFDDISDSIVINEAVEIAKKFGADDDYSFVNGVLGNVVRASKPVEDVFSSGEILAEE